MKSLFLIKNPDLFQGEKYLNTNKNYFEGWYFKNTNHKEGIAFIPGININSKNKKAFIQVITNNSSYHAILSMQNRIDGLVNVNHNKISFNNSIGYIEKDWGCSFPKSYIWCQGNHFQESNISFMLSIADIPFKLFTFRGIICVLIIGGQEFRFATYNNTKLIEYDIDNHSMNITLQKGDYSLNVRATYHAGLKLSAPIKGKMEKDIFESIASSIIVTLKKKEIVIFSDTSTNCGLEIV